MKNLSQSFKRQLFNNERNYIVYADITLADNTELSLTNSEIWAGGFSFEECVSNDDSFDALGAAIVGSAEIVLDNTADAYSEYDFTDAKVVLHIGMNVPQLDGTTVLEKIKIGVYTVNEPTYNGGTIRLGLLDNMILFDKPYDTSLTYPATLDAIVRDACTKCGIVLGTLNFPNKNVSIANKPESDSLTFRTVISWAAAVAGCFAKINPDGKLILSWFDYSSLEYAFNTLDGGTFNPWTGGDLYDGGTFNPWTGGEAYGNTEFLEDHPVCRISSIYSQTIATDDVVITGVRAIVKSESNGDSQASKTYSTGTAGYIVELENNDFITEDTAQAIVDRLGTQLIGLRFRKLNVTCANDPSIEAGDVALVVDRKQNAYVALVTRSSFSVGASQTIVSGASTPQRNSVTQFTSASKTYVEMRKRIKQEQTARELAEQSIRQTITNANGLYLTQQPDAQDPTKTQYYLHNKTQLAESDIQIWFSDAGIMVTPNGTAQVPTWYGLTVNGDMLLNLLIATGINADWINTGSLSVGGQGNTDGSIKIYNASGTLIGEWNKNGIYVIDGTIGGWSILNDGIRKSSGNLGVGMLPGTNAAGTFLYVSETSGSVTKYPFAVFASGQVNMSKANITGGKIELGGLNDVNGEFSLLNSYGQKCVEIGNYYSNAGRITSNYFSGSTSATAICVGRIYLEGSQLRIQSLVNGAWKDNLWLTESGISPGENKTSVSLNGIHSYTTPQQTLVDVDGFEDYDYQTFLTGNVYIQGRVATTSSDFNLMYRLKTHILTVTGTKNRLVSTPDYADRLLYCYETPSPMFGDVGEGIIGEDGKCYVTIDPIFAETVSLKQYQVFLQKYGVGECYVSERKGAYFVVEGTPNLAFGWELKAKQVDFDQLRLERDIDVVKTENEHNYPEESAKHIAEIETINYADAAITHIENIMKERTVA